MSETEETQIPQFVEVEVKEDVALKNLQSGGVHHVFGEDGTHVVLKVSDPETETARSVQRFQLVQNDEDAKGVFAKFLDYLTA